MIQKVGGVLITELESGCSQLQQLEVPYYHFHDVLKNPTGFD